LEHLFGTGSIYTPRETAAMLGTPKPIYVVHLPYASFNTTYFVHGNTDAVGAHGVFAYEGDNVIWAWVFTGNNINDAMVVFTHEVI
jgi:hypothetical protein